MGDEFERLFGFGTKLNGLAFTAGESMKKVEAKLGTDASMNARIDEVKEHLVQKAWRKRGTNKNMFPVPVQYETVLKFGLFFSLDTRLSDVFEEKQPRGTAIEGELMRSGLTYVYDFENQAKVCASLVVAPTDYFIINFQGCRANIDTSGYNDDETEISWSIGLRSVLNIPENENGRQKKHSLLSAFIPSGGNSDDMKQDSATKSIAWKIATRLARNPGVFLGMGSGGAGLGAGIALIAEQLKSEVIDIDKRVRKAIGDAVAAVEAAVRRALDIITFTAYRVMDINLVFTKRFRGNGTSGEYRPSFTAEYKQIKAAKMSFGVPGTWSIRPSLAISRRYDLSEVFNLILNIMQTALTVTPFQKCVECLQQDEIKKLCYSAHSPDQSECKPYGEVCPSEKNETISDVLDCNRNS